jgi:hypothetical protein
MMTDGNPVSGALEKLLGRHSPEQDYLVRNYVGDER